MAKKVKKFGGGGWSGRGGVRIPLDDSAPTGPTITPRRGSGPTAAERAESRAQNADLKKIKVTPKEGRVINSANRSEGGGKAKGGKIVKKVMSRKRFAEGGSTDRYQAKYDRKIADIEKDYKIAQSKGKNADVAKAKYEQRMADARDDLAKWRGDDRSQTSKLEKAAETNLSLMRRYGAPAANKPVETQGEIKPKLADTSSLLKGVATKPTTAQPAAKPMAKKPSGGESTTRAYLERKRTGERTQRIGEETREANRAAFRRHVAGGPDRIGYSSKASPLDAIREGRIQDATARRNALLKGKNNANGSDFGKFISSLLPIGDDDRKYKLAGNAPPGFKKGGKVKPAAKTGVAKAMPTAKQMGDMNMAKGGKVKKCATGGATKAGKAMVRKSADTMGRAMVKKFAKGGSVDGCAIRGKTRAPMKRGK